MKAEEKAKDLVEKMFEEGISAEGRDGYMSKEMAKQCALIAVEFSREFITGDLSERFDKTMYLLEVKNELEKL